MKNTVISISGSSGVGKTTLAKFIGIVLNPNKVTHLCGDDLHLWERDNPNWNSYTHLDPAANNLRKGYIDLVSMRRGRSIKRNRYNHDTGKFDPEKEISPNTYIVNEGLHALLDEFSSISDISLFVETDPELKRQWKINRDTQKRGYTTEQVEDSLKRRELDEIKWIVPQKKNADAVVWFIEKNNSVEFEYDAITKSAETLLQRVKNFYDTHRDFLLLCREVSFEYDLVQHGGGNVSYKINDKIVITSSGSNMSDIGLLDGFSLCEMDGKSLLKTRPSMELGMHTKIKDRVVLHTHPIYLNVILCSENSRELVSEIFSDIEHSYVPYFSPGKTLSDNLNESNISDTIFLENHGLVCSGESFSDVFKRSMQTNEACKRWLVNHSLNFKVFSPSFESQRKSYLFPDAVILEKIRPINNYIIHTQREVGLRPRYLSEDDIDFIRNMEEEKYRESIL